MAYKDYKSYSNVYDFYNGFLRYMYSTQTYGEDPTVVWAQGSEWAENPAVFYRVCACWDLYQWCILRDGTSAGLKDFFAQADSIMKSIISVPGYIKGLNPLPPLELLKEGEMHVPFVQILDNERIADRLGLIDDIDEPKLDLGDPVEQTSNDENQDDNESRTETEEEEADAPPIDPDEEIIELIADEAEKPDQDALDLIYDIDDDA
ncbi:MAG: hypothetical protein LBC43_01605 [Bifidobacteriaceae bacterium]|jgi:hypothetical protein|nr:hypothetical protein [Bifidobacteriaceae bacterium]